MNKLSVPGYGLARVLKRRLIQCGLIPSKPRVLNIFTTSSCNFSCFYCSRNGCEKSSEFQIRYTDQSEFRLEDLKWLFDRYPDLKTVSFVGIGEPFLASDLISMARFARDHGKRTEVITNGSLLHRHSGMIGSAFDQVSISLHGLSGKELRTVAGVDEGVFQQIVQNVQALLLDERKANASLDVRASVVLLKHDFERAYRAAVFCRDHGIPSLDLQNYLPYGRPDCDDCVFDDDHGVVASIGRLISEFAGSVTINPPIFIKRDERSLAWGCTSFFDTLRVDGLGQVCGCSRIMVPAAGNGNFRAEENVWNNRYFRGMRRRFCLRDGLPECCRYCPSAQ